jgi:hypothetical protein
MRAMMNRLFGWFGEMLHKSRKPSSQHLRSHRLMPHVQHILPLKYTLRPVPEVVGVKRLIRPKINIEQMRLPELDVVL